MIKQDDEKAVRTLRDGITLTQQAPSSIDDPKVLTIAAEIVAICDSPFRSSALRVRAADITAQLADQYDSILELVYESARTYVKSQYIDDAFPYSPNAFTVLAQVTRRKQHAVAFLRETVTHEWGIPRWEALRALCQIDHPQADEFIIAVLHGDHPPSQLESRLDIEAITRVKGLAFVNSHSAEHASE
jgi:hypothetical protein